MTLQTGNIEIMNRILYRLKYLLILLLFIVMAIPTMAVAGVGQADDKGFSLQYARGIQMQRHADGILVTIHPAWDKNESAVRYLLVPKGKKITVKDPALQVITVPVQRVVSLSTTHLAYINAAGCTDRLVGLADFKHVNTPSVIQRIEAGNVKAVGNFSNLRIETIMDLSPDLILTSASGSIYDSHPKLMEAGLPTVMVIDHMEAHPLGRLEWIKFLGLLLGTDSHACRLFDQTVAEYKQLVEKTATVSNRPRVLTGAPFQGQWWVARGGSFIAHYIRDAGGDYLWASIPGVSSVPMDIESVYERALSADVWINTGSWKRADESLAADSRFGIIPALEKGRMYNNNKRLNRWGGNDYWESGMLHPEVVLADLIAILHPDLLPDHELFYYRRLGR